MSKAARSTTRSVAVAAAVGGALLLVAAPAQSAPPQAAPFEQFLPGTDTAGTDGFCSFPVLIQGVTNQDPASVANPDGSTTYFFTGYGSAAVKNASTGKTLTYPISGPGTLLAFPDNSFDLDVTGPNLLWTTVANSYPGVPQLAYSYGRVQVSVASSGLTIAYHLNGTRRDVCAALG